jgi:hypothetical protein
LSEIYAYPRLHPPFLVDIVNRLEEIQLDNTKTSDIDLSMFYHSKTLGELVSLREYLYHQQVENIEDDVDRWILMIATNRLTGHSPGFFSVYTLPPNQTISPENQIKINLKRHQTPEYRDTKKLILNKTRQLLNGITEQERRCLQIYGKKGVFLTSDARYTATIPDDTVQLTVTSLPFLDVVQYPAYNWL